MPLAGRALLRHPNNVSAFYNDLLRTLRAGGQRLTLYDLPPTTAHLYRRVYARVGLTLCDRGLHGGGRIRYSGGPPAGEAAGSTWGTLGFSGGPLTGRGRARIQASRRLGNSG